MLNKSKPVTHLAVLLCFIFTSFNAAAADLKQSEAIYKQMAKNGEDCLLAYKQNHNGAKLSDCMDAANKYNNDALEKFSKINKDIISLNQMNTTIDAINQAYQFCYAHASHYEEVAVADNSKVKPVAREYRSLCGYTIMMTGYLTLYKIAKNNEK